MEKAGRDCLIMIPGIPVDDSFDDIIEWRRGYAETVPFGVHFSKASWVCFAIEVLYAVTVRPMGRTTCLASLSLERWRERRFFSWQLWPGDAPPFVPRVGRKRRPGTRVIDNVEVRCRGGGGSVACAVGT